MLCSFGTLSDPTSASILYFIIYTLIKSTEQNPFENPTVVQLLKISIIWWKYNVHYRGQNILRLDPILNQINPVHTPPPNISKIHFNSIFSSIHRSSKGYLAYRIFRTKFCAYSSPFPCVATCLAHLIPLDFIILILFDVELKLWTFYGMHPVVYLLDNGYQRSVYTTTFLQ
jgi:hypothetical protein